VRQLNLPPPRLSSAIGLRSPPNLMQRVESTHPFPLSFRPCLYQRLLPVFPSSWFYKGSMTSNACAAKLKRCSLFLLLEINSPPPPSRLRMEAKALRPQNQIAQNFYVVQQPDFLTLPHRASRFFLAKSAVHAPKAVTSCLAFFAVESPHDHLRCYPISLQLDTSPPSFVKQNPPPQRSTHQTGPVVLLRYIFSEGLLLPPVTHDNK